MSSGEDNSFQKFSPLRTGESGAGEWSLKRKVLTEAKSSQAKKQHIQYPAFTQIDPKLSVSKVRPIWTKDVNPFDDDEVDEYSPVREEEPENPFALEEKELNNQMRMEHQRQREMLANDLLEHAAETRQRLTPGMAKVKRMMEQCKTNDDLSARVSADFNLGLMFVPVVSPATDYVNTALGVPESPTEEPCYGCETGLEAIGITSKLLEDFRSAMEQIEDGARDLVSRCKMISRYWELYVRRPANKGIADGEAKVKAWTAASIHIHYSQHVQEPSVVKQGLLRDWKEIYRVTHERRVFFVSSQFARTGRRPTTNDIYTSSEGLAQLKLSTEMIVKLMSIDERKLPGYRPELHYSKSAMGVLANQITDTVKEKDTNVVFDDIEDWAIQ
jgi:hypothetical protein